VARHGGFGSHRLNRRDALVDLAVQLTRKSCQQSQRAGAFDFGGENQPAAAAFRIKLGVHLEMPERAVFELALLGEPAVFLPLAEPFVPLQSHGTGLGGRGAAGAAIGVDPIRNLIGRRADHFVKARGIGQERPYRLGRLR